VKKSFLFALLLFSSNLYAIPVLDMANSVKGQLAEQETTAIALSVKQGEYLRGTLKSSGPLHNVRLLTPNGSPYKQLNFAPTHEQFFQLNAEETGTYTLEFTAADQAITFSAKLNSFVTVAQQVSTAKPPISPRLQQLQKQLSKGGNTKAFWREVKQQGTPFIEPQAKPGYQLVTFLWQGAKNNVVLLGSPSGEHENLEQLNNSDVWYKSFSVPDSTRLSYQLAPDTPTLPDAEGKNRIALRASTQMDPFNKHPWRVHNKQDRFSTHSTVELKNAPTKHWLKALGHPQGTVKTHTLKSKILGNQRDISIYTPAGFNRSQGTTPLLFFFDAKTYQSEIPTPRILDNLIAEKKIPPAIAVFVSNPSYKSRAEELTCNPDFAKFIAQELHPWVIEKSKISTTAETTLLAGSSYGGLAAACIALSYPEKFGLVLSQSGSFWWSPDYQDTRDFVPEWLPAQIAQEQTKSVRFYLNAGLFEKGWQPSDILPSNRHMQDVLSAKNYAVKYEEFANGHDAFSWRVNLASGLIYLLQAAEIKQP